MKSKLGGKSIGQFWPYVIWKLKNFNNLDRVLIKNVKAKRFSFSLVLIKKRFPDGIGDHFSLSIEDVKHLPEDEETKTYCKVCVRTYILAKLQGKFASSSVKINLEVGSQNSPIWTLGSEDCKKNYDRIKQSNGEVWLVCLFEPKSCPFEICRPMLLPLEYFFSNKYLPWKSLECLSRDFESILENSEGDLVLKSGNNRIFVYKHILFARCKSLEASIKIEEGKICEFEVPDFSGHSLEVFVKYIYCGRISTTDADTAVELFNFSLKYFIEDLTNMCVSIMIHLATEENVLELLQLAENNNHKILKARIIDYIINTKFLKSQQWITFSEDNTGLALEIYHANVLKQCHYIKHSHT